MDFDVLRWVDDGYVRMLDQTRLPLHEEHLEVRTVEEMFEAIRRLSVRGAPAIGVAAAFGALLGAVELARGAADAGAVLEAVRTAAARLAEARPTAVNLFVGLERITARAEAAAGSAASGRELFDALLAEALAMQAENVDECERIGSHGAALVPDGARVLTHCNAGALATVGIGTALAPIYAAARGGKSVRVLADETRPLLQGARLTSWELARSGVEVTLITDGAAGWMMSRGEVDLVIVGSDRIARNGDVCNKIGTFGVAVLARHHGLPFYVAAPLSTFDLELASGADIPIEERSEREVTEGFGPATAPGGIAVRNPAFDVTPAELVTAIVTEAGTLERPDADGVTELLRRGGRLPVG